MDLRGEKWETARGGIFRQGRRGPFFHGKTVRPTSGMAGPAGIPGIFIDGGQARFVERTAPLLRVLHVPMSPERRFATLNRRAGAAPP